MSLLGGGLTGDIWSTGAFSFESPLKDLLDSGDFTLEQLLAEDELLQEMRGVHPKLMAYFQTEAAVTKLVQYLILPPDEEEMGNHDHVDVDVPSKETANAETSGTDTDSASAAETAVAAANEADADTATAAASDEQPQQQVQQPPTQQVQHQRSTKQLRQPGEWLEQHLESKSKNGGGSMKKKFDPEMKHIRFPYMACEIICCEINGVLSALVDGYVVYDKDTEQSTVSSDLADSTQSIDDPQQQLQQPPVRILDLFFSALFDTDSGKLDDYRAGYFDKILSVLFRRRPIEMSAFINAGGCHGRPALMRAILNHLYSHSIMQIVQRLLLPQRPFATNSVGEDGGEGGDRPDDELLSDALDPNMNNDIDDGPRFECDWSEAPEALETLLDILMGTDVSQAALESSVNNSDSTFSRKEILEEHRLNLSQNASEVLITIIQHSLLSSKTMLTLTLPENLGKVVTAATTLPAGTSYFSPHESLLTSAMNVLESLILQLGGYGAVGTMSVVMPEDEGEDGVGAGPGTAIVDSEPYKAGSDQETTQETSIVMETDQGNEESIEDSFEVQNKDPLIADLSTMIEHLPRLLGNLAKLLRHPSTAQWKSPMQFSKSESQPLLGTSRLRIVRVLEAMVLLGDPEVDSYLVQSDCLETCLDLFWEFQWCSILHQSVANLLVHVFEGGNARVDMQEYFIIRCNLLSRLMDSYLEMEVTPNIPAVVLGLKDLHHLGAGGATSSIGSDKGSSDHLPVSEDDVDAALEQESEAQDQGASPEKETPATETAEMTSVDHGSMEAVQFESNDNSIIGAGAPSQPFRLGYMGHVIIICQALVHASTEDADENQEEGPETRKATDGESGDGQDGGVNGFADVSREDTLQEPLLLAEMVKYHPAVERWHAFMSTTLASETTIQATPLGGFNAAANGDSRHSHRPGLEEEDMMDDDGSTPALPPRGMLGGGDVIDMDDNDLDIAASMISGVSFGRQNSSGSGGDNDSDGGNSGNSGDSQRTYDSGETANSGSGYMFDDPLGKMKEGELGIELGKLMNYKTDGGKGTGKVDEKASKTAADDDEEENDSSSDEEPERQRSNSEDDDEDVPTMDLFAGNFSYGDSDQPAEPQEGDSDAPDWSNFANFDDAGESNNDDEFGAFTSAEKPATPDAADPSASEGSSSNAEIEEMFGKFDHATLLETDDDPQTEEFEPFSHPLEEIKPVESPATEDAALTAPLPEVEAANEPVESSTTADAALTAPSPEVEAAAMNVQPVALVEEATATTAVEESSQPERSGPEESSPANKQSDDIVKEPTPVEVAENEIKEPLHAPENGSAEEPSEIKETLHAPENRSAEEPSEIKETLHAPDNGSAEDPATD